MNRKIVIGTRGSKLALKQSDIVKEKLLAKHPDLQIEIKIIKTEGDTNASPIPLDTIGKGWFTKEIENELLGGQIDIAVHSLKDLPEELPPGLCIAAYPEREDPRDVLVSKSGADFAALPQGAVIGTDSTRRDAQARALRPDIKVKSVRGNVPTRLQKLAEQDYDAIIIAAAGLKRLGLEAKITQYFEPDQLTPAPGQGILAVEARQNDPEVQALMREINDADAELVAKIERNFSKVVGGGCKEPVGAYALCDAESVTLLGMAAKPDGTLVVRQKISGSKNQAEELSAKLAAEILKEINPRNAEK